MSYQKVHTYILLWFYVANDDEKELTSFKIVEQIEFIQKVFLPEVKLNDSAINKKLGDQTQFSLTKHSRKRKMNLLLPIYIFVRYHQFDKNFFICLKMFHMQCRKNLKKRYY